MLLRKACHSYITVACLALGMFGTGISLEEMQKEHPLLTLQTIRGCSIAILLAIYVQHQL